jgi:flagellar hook-associated protein 2
MATINSLGIGSGVLTADVIDQLKENDRSLTVTPIDNKLELNTQKEQSLELFESLITTLQSSVSSLEDSSLYEKREVSGSNDGIEVEALTGVDVQDFTISDVKLAYGSVTQSGSFASKTNGVASADGTLNLNIDGTDYQIDYTSTMSYDDLKSKINDVAGDKVTASILQTGDSSYSLIVKSDETGEDQQIVMTDLSGNLESSLKSDQLRSDDFDARTSKIASAGTSGTLTLNAAGTDYSFSYDEDTKLTDLVDMINEDPDASQNVYATIIQNDAGKFNLVINAKNAGEDQAITLTDNDGGIVASLTNTTSDSGDATDIQTARDASFKYNGIDLTRSSNTIDDIKVGLTIKLIEEDASANISITQDEQPIKDELQAFVDAYNAMTDQLDTMTLADTENEQIGIFNGDNTLVSIGREMRSIITERDYVNNLGLGDYGVTIDRTGNLSFDKSVFDEKFQEDPQALTDYFSGHTTETLTGREERVDGIFEKLYDNIRSLTRSGGSITNLNEGLSREATLLEDSRTRALDTLNSRYDAMSARFVQYDAMISRLNNQFSALSQQISMAING